MTDAQKQGRRTLLLISLLFTIPIVSAMYMYFSGTAVPVTSTEHGEFISPPRLLPETPLSTTDQEQRLRKIWSLIVLADTDCDTTCLTSLEKIRQVRLSLGPKMTRMQTVFLPTDSAAIRTELKTEHPVLIIVAPEQSAAIREAVGPFENGEIFLADPLGNLMMRYPQDADMGDIRKDIAHLFKLSGIG
jgi:hypothetical protein